MVARRGPGRVVGEQLSENCNQPNGNNFFTFDWKKIAKKLDNRLF